MMPVENGYCKRGKVIMRESLTKESLYERYAVGGESIREISRATGYAESTISKHMKVHEIEQNPHGHYIKRNYIDSSGFLDVSDDWHAYWIGFLAADGCIYEDGKNSIRVQLHLQQSDADHMKNFRDGVGSKSAIRFGGKGGSSAAILCLYDPPLATALARWGIVPNKTLQLSWPTDFPEHLLSAYIRGYFDGDGTVYQRHRKNGGSNWTETICRFIGGSQSFLERLKTELEERGIETLCIYRNQQSNAFFLPLSGRRENLLVFSEFLYTGSTVCLERKKEIFNDLERYHQAHPRVKSWLRYKAS